MNLHRPRHGSLPNIDIAALAGTRFNRRIVDYDRRFVDAEKQRDSLAATAYRRAPP